MPPIPLAQLAGGVPASVGEAENLFGLDRDGLRAQFSALGQAPWRADQVMQWIYRRGVDDFDAMTNLGKSLRTELAGHFRIHLPQCIAGQRSADGTRKWVLQLEARDGRPPAAIETVYIPEDGRGTLCISSQAGCAMDCSFCSTAQGGFSRNLTTAEIIAQVWFAAKTLAASPVAEPAARGRQPLLREGEVISNVVFMGMGEPLANYANVLTALRILLDDFGFGLSKRRVTVSTSGLVPFIDRLSVDVDTALAISLHAPDDALRDQLVPLNRKYPIAELMAACRRYVAGKDRKTHIVYEYVMLDGVNDQPERASQLARLLGDMPAKINLIPFNPFPGTHYRRSPPDVIARFVDILHRKGIVATTRRTRGDDIDAACGQLVGRIKSRQKHRLGDLAVKAS
ncbi:MAG: 23S rRNA (adenine(2503)-C(2))-methyltransferase RlmN [Nevskiaceae bacterium]|nr:MAG: 23S rRNA (adenine(2503)-C(2))-methyltransferase RlmN [Nevskiaceae bacterium]TBR73750.1 MAG: 23S rRNA (adenine(2503)-C(2))-methyltransferase RlmN [Nevskiaceae bacterium]